MKLMELIVPRIRWRLLPPMLGIACLGALIAGCYGILHDQITYSISPEYFTKLKSAQFDYADFGFPIRVFVGEIGFLATWWVGAFSGWFLARIALPAWPVRVAFLKCLAGFGIVFVLAASAALAGYCLGLCHSGDYSYWRDLCQSLDIRDIPAFVRVAYIHNGGYLGGLVGLVIALVVVFCQRKLAKR
jgi:hypothetical protein